MNTFLTLLLVLSLSAIVPAQPNANFITTTLSWMTLIEKIEQLYQRKRKEADESNSHEVKK
jgi:hypothetical protein